MVVTNGFLFPTGRKGFGPGEQEFGYVDVRPGAHMFYWLYYTTAQEDWTQRPLVMWLQGGPGGSSTSFGNFAEIGPLTFDQEERNSTWVGCRNEKTDPTEHVSRRAIFATKPQELHQHSAVGIISRVVLQYHDA